MGKKNKNQEQQTEEFVKAGPSDCGTLFDASEATLEDTKKQVRLEHPSKAWTRDAWERARPFILEQRQKLESSGWAGGDAARTELYVLKRNAPHGAMTEDGFMYIRIPKKFIDYFRTSKAGGEEGAAPADEAAEDDKKKKATRSKRKENAPSYEMTNEYIWKVKVDGADSEEAGREPTVVLDVIEPLENLFYLVMALSPGLARLQYNRKDAIQAGTKQSDLRDDGDSPTMRHRAMVAANEKLTRSLPPSYWLKKNAEELRKVLGPDAFDATMHAAEDSQRATTRDVKNVQEKVWEEKMAKPEDKKGAKKDKAAATA